MVPTKPAAGVATRTNVWRVLLVDDNLSFLMGLQRFLANEPELQIVGRAHSGAEAIREVHRLCPELVLMDLSMPEMDGLTATRQLKANPDSPRVVLLTVYDDQAFRHAAHGCGADGFITKGDLGTELLPLLHALREKSSRPHHSGQPGL